ncbi:MAG: FAD-binding oxidoreductase [Rhodocyclaceae bacterium]
MSIVLIVLAATSLAALAFVTYLLADGVRNTLARRRIEQARRPLELVVTRRDDATDELFRVQLARPNGKRLPHFVAGQHVVLSAPAGPGGKTVRRAYSLAAWQRRPRSYELGIKREPEGVMSSWAWQALGVGARITSSPPKGDFVLDTNARHVVLIGGGIGITPMRAMLQQALAHGRTSTIVLVHAARHRADLIYHSEFASLARQHAELRYFPMLSRPDPLWQGESGRLDATRLLAAIPHPQDATFYLCAGMALMNALSEGLTRAGIAPARIHWEAFGVASAAASSGTSIRVDDGFECATAGEPSLLATLEANGFTLASECRAGSCGECRMKLIDGEVDWLIPATCELTAQDILPCICQARGDLRLAR